MFRTFPLSIISSLLTVHSAMVYIILVLLESYGHTGRHPSLIRKTKLHHYIAAAVLSFEIKWTICSNEFQCFTVHFSVQ